MGRNGGSSWAGQWDYNHHHGTGGAGGGRAKYSKKFGEGFAKTKAAAEKFGEGFSKTKAVASTGLKKVKGGASVGLHWLKDKCHKTTHN